MRFSVAAVGAALLTGASAAGSYSNDTTIYTTQVVTAYTTYCPTPTSIVYGNQTYVVTAATTVTITNCPCTFVAPVITSSAVICSTCSAGTAPISTGPVAGATFANSSVAAGAPQRSLVPAGVSTSGVSPPAASTTAISAPVPTGAANRDFVASWAGIAGLLGLGLVALFL